MVEQLQQSLSLQEFLSLSEKETNLELVAGQAVAKMSPQYSHASVQTALVLLLAPWAQARGRVRTEWSVVLRRRERDWVPVPDFLYVSFDRLAADWFAEGPCPLAPELVVEIVSPDQSFGAMAAKAGDYLAAGVERVWVIDPAARTLTVFFTDRAPVTLTGAQAMTDPFLPGLAFSPEELFRLSGLPEC